MNIFLNTVTMGLHLPLLRVAFIAILMATIGIIEMAEADEGSEMPITMSEVAVTATRIQKDTFDTPNAISVIDHTQIQKINADITPRILQETVGVWSQQTTVGQGSPHLRGLTGYQTYIQVDGVRLNNSTFRSGPNQYLATISPDSLDRVEVLRGPGSMLYGSGAMGGVISLFTVDPILNTDSNVWNVQPQVFSRVASATMERMGRLEVIANRDRVGLAIGASARGFGDLNPGRGYDLHYKNRKFEIVTERPSGVPLVEGPPKEVPDQWLIDTETPLDWTAYDGDAKLAYQLDDRSRLSLAYQLWRQPSTPRYDKIGPREYDAFYFEPQNRDLVYGTYSVKPDTVAIDELDLTLSYHRQKEGNNRVKRDATERTRQFDTVHTLGLSTQMVSKALSRQRLTLGGDFYWDTLDSHTLKTDLTTGQQQTDESQGVFINGSQFWDANLFAQDEIALHERVELTLGGRFTLYHTQADLALREPSFDAFNDSGNALTGSAGIVVGLTDGLNLVTNAATSFRAPSLNDTTAVVVTNEGIDAPSPDLNSETGWTVEGGLKARYSWLTGSLTLFHSRINDLVTRVPVEDAYTNQPLPRLYQDIQAQNPGVDVFVFDNVDEVQIQGIELNTLVLVASDWSLVGNATLTRGKVLLLDGAAPDPTKPWEERIRREPPLNGMLGVNWQPDEGRFSASFFVRGAAKQDRLNEGDIRDPRIPGTTRDVNEVEFGSDGRAIGQGSPGWFTLNLRGGFQVVPTSRIHLSLENLLDRRYREHGTGIDAPGFNAILSVAHQF